MHHTLLFTALIGFVSINVYLFIRGWQALPENKIIRALFSVILLFFLASVILEVFFSKSLHAKLGNDFTLIGGYWIIFSVFFLLAALFADLLRILNYYFKIFPAWVNAHYSKVKLIYFASVLLFIFITSLYGLKWFNNTQTVKLNLSVNKDNHEFETLNLVAASDFHLGKIIQKDMLARWVDIINKKNPDIILLAGDLFDRSFDFTESKNFEKELIKLKSRYGVFAVLGNHDYYAGVGKAINCIEQSGIKMLRDQVVTVDNRFVIIGRDDAINEKRKTVDSLMTGLDPNLPKILLDHKPYLNESVKNKIDLQISGHFHNGQIFPYNLVISKLWELSYGYRKIGDTHFYVSSGLGVSYVPIRLGTQSEIVRILLKAKSDTLTMNN